MYEELKDQNFEVIAVAQDTAGVEVVGPLYEDAKATYTTLVDVNHTVSSLYDMVNVPTGVWIDEEGRIVRWNEGTYAAKHAIGTIKFGTDVYSPAVRDWVLKGADSVYANTPEEVASKFEPRTPDEALAEPTFKLGVYFHQTGDEARANRYWEAAQKLNPDSWNYHRQDWSFTPEQANQNWARKVGQLGDKPYYEPLDLPEPATGH